MSFMLDSQNKQCNHSCYPSTTRLCCKCSDLREYLKENTYPIYRDGVGWVDEGTRDHGYCPICNPKNYTAWNEKIEIQRKKKIESDLVLMQENEILENNIVEDRNRAALVGIYDVYCSTFYCFCIKCIVEF